MAKVEPVAKDGVGTSGVVLWTSAPPEERVVDLARARRPLKRASRPIRFVQGGLTVVWSRDGAELSPPPAE